MGHRCRSGLEACGSDLHSPQWQKGQTQRALEAIFIQSEPTIIAGRSKDQLPELITSLLALRCGNQEIQEILTLL